MNNNHPALVAKLCKEIAEETAAFPLDGESGHLVSILANLRHLADLGEDSFAALDRYAHQTYLSDKEAGRVGGVK